jgi:hypothetical protein
MQQKQREDLVDEDQAMYGLGETRDYWYKSAPRHSICCSLILSIPIGYLWDQCPMGSRSLRSEERGDGIQLGPSEETWLRHLP